MARRIRCACWSRRTSRFIRWWICRSGTRSSRSTARARRRRRSNRRGSRTRGGSRCCRAFRIHAGSFPSIHRRSPARGSAVLPTLQNPRCFFPLDPPSIAAGGFSLYTPARRSAHGKNRLVRLAALFRVPMWYRDTIVIAQRQAPPLENKLTNLFSNQTIRLALSSGAPEPAINRKASAVVLGRGGRVLAFVKIAGSEVSRRILEHEATILPALADRASLAAFVPRMLFAGEVDGRYMTVQSPLAGKPAATAMTNQHA